MNIKIIIIIFKDETINFCISVSMSSITNVTANNAAK